MSTMQTRTLASLFAFLLAAPALAQDVLVVAPKEFDDSIAAWKSYREGQGLTVAVREPSEDVGAVVKDAYAKSGNTLRFVMLVGDVEKVPCALRPRKATGVVAQMDADPNIASDAPWADVDGDGVPDVAIGRVPAHAPDEAKAYLSRVVAYETNADFGPWRDKLNVVAGTGGFGPLVDAAVEKLTRDLLSALPAQVDVSMTYAHPLSPFCPPPAKFADYAVKRWNEGALVVAYVGHGSTRNVDAVHVGKDTYPILGMAEVGKIAAEHGAPVSVFVACSTGHIDGDRDCLAEALLKRPAGPIAVIASSRVSSPYSNGIVAKELLDALYVVEAKTTGELLVVVKKRLLDAPNGDAIRERLEKIAEAMFDKSAENRRADRADHALLYNLLGDPCARIARPSKIAVAAPNEIAAGATLHVTGRVDEGGAAVVELVRRKDPPPKLSGGVRTTDDDFRVPYEAANSHGVARVDVDVKAGDFAVDVPVPADAPLGPCAVRVYVAGKTSAFAGAADLTLVAPATK
jgi:hypothetical protein